MKRFDGDILFAAGNRGPRGNIVIDDVLYVVLSLFDVSLSAGDGTKVAVADEVKLNILDASTARRDHV